jgi:hypothetical protein
MMTPSGFNFRSAAQAFAFAHASLVETTSPSCALTRAKGRRACVFGEI